METVWRVAVVSTKTSYEWFLELRIPKTQKKQMAAPAFFVSKFHKKKI
jgi:hypothetical protein